MAHVPDQAVVRRVENIVKSYGQFDRPQAGSQVPPGLGDRVHHALSYLLSQGLEFLQRENLQVPGAIYPGQESQSNLRLEKGLHKFLWVENPQVVNILADSNKLYRDGEFRCHGHHDSSLSGSI